MFYSGKALIQYEQEAGQTSLNHERKPQGKSINTAAWQAHHDIDPKYYRDASKHGICSTIVQHAKDRVCRKVRIVLTSWYNALSNTLMTIA